MATEDPFLSNDEKTQMQRMYVKWNENLKPDSIVGNFYASNLIGDRERQKFDKKETVYDKSDFLYDICTRLTYSNINEVRKILEDSGDEGHLALAEMLPNRNQRNLSPVRDIQLRSESASPNTLHPASTENDQQDSQPSEASTYHLAEADYGVGYWTSPITEDYGDRETEERESPTSSKASFVKSGRSSMQELSQESKDTEEDICAKIPGDKDEKTGYFRIFDSKHKDKLEVHIPESVLKRGQRVEDIQIYSREVIHIETIGSDTPINSASPVYEFLPHGTVFKEPVLIKFPIKMNGQFCLNGLRMLYSNTAQHEPENWVEICPNDETHKDMSWLVLDGTVYLWTSHFSKFTMVYDTGDKIPFRVLLYVDRDDEHMEAKLTVSFSCYCESQHLMKKLRQYGDLVDEQSMPIDKEKKQVQITLKQNTFCAQDWDLMDMPSEDLVFKDALLSVCALNALPPHSSYKMYSKTGKFNRNSIVSVRVQQLPDGQNPCQPVLRWYMGEVLPRRTLVGTIWSGVWWMINKTSQWFPSWLLWFVPPKPPPRNVISDCPSSDVQPDSSSSDVQPDCPSSDVQPDSPSSDVQPDSPSSDVQPDNQSCLSSDVQPNCPSSEGCLKSYLPYGIPKGCFFDVNHGSGGDGNNGLSCHNIDGLLPSPSSHKQSRDINGAIRPKEYNTKSSLLALSPTRHQAVIPNAIPALACVPSLNTFNIQYNIITNNDSNISPFDTEFEKYFPEEFGRDFYCYMLDFILELRNNEEALTEIITAAGVGPFCNPSPEYLLCAWYESRRSKSSNVGFEQKIWLPEFWCVLRNAGQQNLAKKLVGALEKVALKKERPTFEKRLNECDAILSSLSSARVITDDRYTLLLDMSEHLNTKRAKIISAVLSGRVGAIDTFKEILHDTEQNDLLKAIEIDTSKFEEL